MLIKMQVWNSNDDPKKAEMKNNHKQKPPAQSAHCRHTLGKSLDNAERGFAIYTQVQYTRDDRPRAWFIQTTRRKSFK